jgi:hypothetical protein
LTHARVSNNTFAHCELFRSAFERKFALAKGVNESWLSVAAVIKRCCWWPSACLPTALPLLLPFFRSACDLLACCHFNKRLSVYALLAERFFSLIQEKRKTVTQNKKKKMNVSDNF